MALPFSSSEIANQRRGSISKGPGEGKKSPGLVLIVDDGLTDAFTASSPSAEKILPGLLDKVEILFPKPVLRIDLNAEDYEPPHLEIMIETSMPEPECWEVLGGLRSSYTEPGSNLTEARIDLLVFGGVS